MQRGKHARRAVTGRRKVAAAVEEAPEATAEAATRIAAIQRGKRRAVLSIVIEATGYDDAVPFEPMDVAAATRDDVRAALFQLGLVPVAPPPPGGDPAAGAPAAGAPVS